MLGKYTAQSENETLTITSLLDGSQTNIKSTNKHYSKFIEAAKEKRIINYNKSGRVTICADYGNDYKNSSSSTAATPKTTYKTSQLLKTMEELNIDTAALQPIKTNTAFDKFCSTEGGFLPGTNIMAAGAAGSGKTTLLLQLLEGAQKNGSKVLFISCEMGRLDLARYIKRFPNWSKLPILFLNEFSDNCPKEIVEQVLSEGWDLILTDSYTELNDAVKESCQWTRSATEKWILDLMTKNNEGNNKAKIFTTFCTILQQTKGGNFVGSNKLKHMTSAMMDIKFENGLNSGPRFMEFTKNRCGNVGDKLYFNIGDYGLTIDEERYQRELEYNKIISENSADDTSWDEIFESNKAGSSIASNVSSASSLSAAAASPTI